MSYRATIVKVDPTGRGLARVHWQAVTADTGVIDQSRTSRTATVVSTPFARETTSATAALSGTTTTIKTSLPTWDPVKAIA